MCILLDTVIQEEDPLVLAQPKLCSYSIKVQDIELTIRKYSCAAHLVFTMKSDPTSGASVSSDSISTNDDYYGLDDSDNESDTVDNSLSKPFDMKLLKQSIENGSKVFDHVTGKNVVLIVGKTGTGKSTLIQGIAGKRLQQAIHTTNCSGNIVEKSVYEAVDALPNFEIGHAKSSHTKSFCCFVPPKGEKKRSTVYVDTPGFEDTDNQEIDIATSIMLSHIAKKCKTLKFVVLVNYTSLLEDRGGAARSILKFTRAFVKDFGKDKQSFLFLFTHTDEIKGISGDLNSAKKTLLDEILRLIDGTNKSDSDLLCLLSFMKTSLLNGLPFVDILHPLDTNFETLKLRIESVMRPIREPTISTNCGLTGPARHKLSGELTGVLLRTRKHLESTPPNIEGALENREMLQYIGENIDLGDVQRSVEDVNALIDNYVTEAKDWLMKEVKKGGVGEFEFHSRTAENIRDALVSVQKLGAAQLVQHVKSMIARTVLGLELSLWQNNGLRPTWHARNLNKLHSWCKAFDMFGTTYPEVLCRLNFHIQECVSAVVKFDFHVEVQQEALCRHMDNLCFLDHVLKQSGQLSDHEIDLHNVRQALRGGLESINALLSSWREEISDAMDTDTLDEVAAILLLSRVLFLERLQDAAADRPAFFDLRHGAFLLSQDLQRNLSSHFEVSCNILMKRDSLELQEPLRKLRTIVKLFDDIRGQEATQIRHNYDRLVQTVITTLKFELDTYTAEAKTVSTSGLVDGKRAGEALNRISEHCWIDDIISSESSIVSEGYWKCTDYYENRCISIQTLFRNWLDKLNVTGKRKRNEKICDGFTGSSETLRALKSIYHELEEIEAFALATGKESIKVDCRELRSGIVRQAKRIIDAVKSCMTPWQDIATQFPNVRSLERLDIRLEAMNLIQCLTNDPICQKDLKDAQAFVVSTFSSAINEIDRVFASQANFGEMARFLDLIAAADGYAYISAHLPSLNDLKERARLAMVQLAQMIGKLVEETADWDLIEKHLKELEKAKVLDSYLLDEVEIQLRPLLALRDQKEMAVDSEIEDMIQKEDFQSIGQFLLPLAESNDQLKRKKFHGHLRTIQTQLQARIDNSAKYLSVGLPTESTARHIVEIVTKMEEAQKELGKHLRALHLKQEMRKLRLFLNESLRDVLARMETDLRDRNLLRFVSNMEHVRGFVLVAKESLKPALLLKQETIGKNYDRVLCSVPKVVERFFLSNFEDGRNLVDSLSGLRQASQSDRAGMEELSIVYNNATAEIDKRLRADLKELERVVIDTGCYEDANNALRSLKRHLDVGLQDHIDEGHVHTVEKLLDSWLAMQRKNNSLFNFLGPDADKTRLSLVAKLNELDPKKETRFGFAAIKRWYSGAEYRNVCKKTEESILGLHEQGLSALKSDNFVLLEECIHSLLQLDKQVGKHVRKVREKATDLEVKARGLFLSVCKQYQDSLVDMSGCLYESLFPLLRSLVLEIGAVSTSKECEKKFNLMNQLFYERLEKEVSEVEGMLSLSSSSFDVLQIKSKVECVRNLGGFAADHYTLFFSKLENCDRIAPDKWLKEIVDICHRYFSAGRNFSKMKHFVVLGVVPSSTYKEVKKAYMRLALRYHPDKVASPGEETNERFRAIQEAWDALDNAEMYSVLNEKRPLDELVRSIGIRLREGIQDMLKHQQYEAVVQSLFQLSSIGEIADLVSPKLDSAGIQDNVTSLVKQHVKQVRVSVKSHWSERKYRELHEDIEDLKEMEKNFKAVSGPGCFLGLALNTTSSLFCFVFKYPEIFPESWNDGIVQAVEAEIQELGKEARACLASKQTARTRKDDFRSLFLRMGCVLVELPSFKHTTREIMSSVLESCLDSDWGYGYLFELGLSLQKGDEGSEEENRVAQLVLSEFSHFKEVMTMVWNEETIQKPVEDTVDDIQGYRQRQGDKKSIKLDIDSIDLLSSFRAFEEKYQTLLGEYLRTGADLSSLVRKTTQVADRMKPLTCDIGWTKTVKRSIPNILAGVFALFTVLKSGDSYNRLESSSEASEIGDKLLMKPHNIQVLTLLCMFGCGQISTERLESQLMQIRTGEGKSMILGAAASVLGLLGFRVRCVCYSDYLSQRDYGLFEEVFDQFQIKSSIKYSKITSLSEDSTARKGDIRCLTEEMLRGSLDESRKTKKAMVDSELLQLSKSQPQQHSGEPTPQRRSLRSSVPQRRSLRSSVPQRRSLRSSVSQRRSLRSSGTQSRSLQGTKEDFQPSELDETNNTAGFWSLSNDSIGSVAATNSTTQASPEEILLVDEVDVFFGAEFYGQTYNQVAQLREPEVAEILKTVWGASKAVGRRQQMSDLKKLPAYQQLLQKILGFEFLLENEIALMLSQVRRVDDEQYYLDPIEQRIGYKVMDTVSYEVTYGYRTVFAYLREYDRGNVNDDTLKRVLTMPVSCGQFSYANIRPKRILGVSGTLDVMSRYEKNVLTKYGVNTYLFVPSVYGKSNFVFDEAGSGISIESKMSDFYHKICDEIKKITKQKRAVIVFFRSMSQIRDFSSSPFYKKLGRQKKILSEELMTADKDFVINKAATAGQVTLCPAVFGRGTDFFCKDGKVEENGGVHVIQTFLSEERSEEVQIQGRTARQGKQGSYKLVLLEDDLVETFGISPGEKDSVPKSGWYQWLCNARDKYREECAKKIEADLADATKKDRKTHEYFDALLASDKRKSSKLFKDIYLAMKKTMPSSVTIDLCFAVDVTGSMMPFMQSIVSTAKNLLQGTNSIGQKLNQKFPEMEFKFRIGVLGFRDIDDEYNQFVETVFSDDCHFTENPNEAVSVVQRITANASGGSDLAEDSLGAIDRCLKWNGSGDWTGTIKCLLLLTDAPAHGMAPKEYSGILNGDSYSTRHPSGLTAEGVVGDLITRDVDLFFCSFKPGATSRTEETISELYLEHPKNSEEREISLIPMVPKEQFACAEALAAGGASKHIIFVLDESGSMENDWSGVVIAYQKYLHSRLQSQSCLDLVSVVQFSGCARLTIDREAILVAAKRTDLSYGGGGTRFSPAASLAAQVVPTTPSSHSPVVVFMSDGGTGHQDSAMASQTFSQINTEVIRRFKSDLELHVIAFGGGADTRQLSDIARASRKGRLHACADSAALLQTFENIAGGQEVASMLESQIGRRISEAVADKLSLEYLR
eukprot:scaffold14918_cov77-Cylindrotheca_fusiformis.AAC.1